MSTNASSAPAAHSQPPRRRWLQFSLRTLLLLVVPMACVFAWLGAEYRRGHRQHEAIAWVEQQGGTIAYDNAATQANWRRQWLGDWYPESVGRVDLRDLQVSDLAPLAGLENLQVLSLSGTQVSDLAPLAGLANLYWLYLEHTQVSELTPLASLVNLRMLFLDHTQVSELTPLAGIVKLLVLTLAETQVSDQQVQALQKALPNCGIHREP